MQHNKKPKPFENVFTGATIKWLAIAAVMTQKNPGVDAFSASVRRFKGITECFVAVLFFKDYFSFSFSSSQVSALPFVQLLVVLCITGLDSFVWCEVSCFYLGLAVAVIRCFVLESRLVIH